MTGRLAGALIALGIMLGVILVQVAWWLPFTVCLVIWFGGEQFRLLRGWAARGLRASGTWLGDRLPDPAGSWLLRVSSEPEEEPWTDSEGRLMRP